MKLSKKFAILAAVTLLMVTWRPLLAIVTNAVTDYIQIGAPSNPASGNSRVYVDSTSHKLSCLNSDGSSCAPSGGGGSFIQPLTAPVSASFAQLNFNQGGATTTQTNNSSPVTSITVSQLDSSGNQETAALIKSPIAATFTITIGTSMSLFSSQGLGGLFLYDGSSNNLFWGIQNQATFRAPVFSNLSGSFSTDAIGPTDAIPGGPLAWFRIQETVSARNYSYSSDGINFTQVFTESNTAHFTTAKYGWGVQERGGATALPTSLITVYSFTETNP
jgi:hypothetical protein